jgi:hypothetical protein
MSSSAALWKRPCHTAPASIYSAAAGIADITALAHDHFAAAAEGMGAYDSGRGCPGCPAST